MYSVVFPHTFDFLAKNDGLIETVLQWLLVEKLNILIDELWLRSFCCFDDPSSSAARWCFHAHFPLVIPPTHEYSYEWDFAIVTGRVEMQSLKGTFRNGSFVCDLAICILFIPKSLIQVHLSLCVFVQTDFHSAFTDVETPQRDTAFWGMLDFQM